jgi:lipoprotein NlpI
MSKFSIDSRRTATLAVLAIAAVLNALFELPARSAGSRTVGVCSSEKLWSTIAGCMPETDRNQYGEALSNRDGIDLAVDQTAEPEFGDIQMVRLDRSNVGVHRHTGIAHQAKNDAIRTVDQYSAFIKHNPGDDDSYFHRGIAYFYEGLFFKARTDLRTARNLDPSYAYYPLWLDIVNQRSHRESRLAQAAARLNMTKWPYPVIRMFLGELSPEAVLSAAADESETVEKQQTCEANFYVGQLALRQGSKEEAERRFQVAASDCPQDFVKGPAARAELAALGTERK